MNKPIDSENDSHEYKNFVKTIVRYGDIGEKKIKFQPCSVTIDSYNCDKHFLLTDKAIYALSNDYMLVSRILLESIIKIGRDSDKRAIVVFQKKNAYFFRLPLVVADNILDAALNIGISKIDVEDLEDDSYTNLINN